MVCLGLEPGAAGWKVQTNPLSYGGTPTRDFGCLITHQCVTNLINALPMITLESFLVSTTLRRIMIIECFIR